MYGIESIISRGANVPIQGGQWKSKQTEVSYSKENNTVYKENNTVSPKGAVGDSVPLRATHAAHYGFSEPVAQKDDDFVSDFARALKRAFDSVNGLQVKSDRLTRALAVNPDSVDVHDVTIAAEKARLALLFTKSIVDKVTQSYRELINMR